MKEIMKENGNGRQKERKHNRKNNRNKDRGTQTNIMAKQNT